MSCKQCSKLRCKLYGLASGLKSTFIEADYCGPGQACRVKRLNGYGYQELSLGSDWSTFVPYLKILVKAFKQRFKK